jgi:hypothetical protein
LKESHPLWWRVDHLDVDRLLQNWRWLCPQKLKLVARNVFGDLFLSDESGLIFRLDVAIGELEKVADSEDQFLENANSDEQRNEWFAEDDERAAASRALTPTLDQCIGFSVPLMFKEAGSPDTSYVLDIYDCVGCLGDMHRQIGALPDGSKVKIVVKPPPNLKH